MQVSEFPIWTGKLADAIAARGAKAAADAMALEFHTELTDVTLRVKTHGRGEVTPSQPGEPPALVTGTLRRAARVVPALEGQTRAVASCRVAAVYARIQEKGGVINAKRAPFLRFQYPAGQWHSVKSVTLPARPYMAPTLALLLVTGRLKARAATAVYAVMQEAGE